MICVPGGQSQATVSDEPGAESLAHSRLHAGEVVGADNGSGERCSVATVADQQADGVFGITPATFPLQDADGEAVDVAAWLRQVGEVVRSLACWCVSPGQCDAVRLLALPRPAQAAEAARQRQRQKARKHGRALWEATLFWAGWI